jgi:hypothetical protein
LTERSPIHEEDNNAVSKEPGTEWNEKAVKALVQVSKAQKHRTHESREGYILTANMPYSIAAPPRSKLLGPARLPISPVPRRSTRRTYAAPPIGEPM